MATAQRKNIKRRRAGHQARKTQQRSNSSRWLVLGIGLFIVGLLVFGTAQTLGFGFDQGANAATLNVEPNALQSTSIDSGHGQQGVADVPVGDRESRYLGPASDPASASLAEAGQLGQPTLLWFHADWCHVCQRIKPEVVDLGEQFDGQVKIVRLNVDHAESRAAVQRYGVRATPTFVLFDAEGQVRGNVPGWPGYPAFTGAFDQLLTGG